MRIIAGTLKGRRLEAPRWPGLRPTSDRLRETLFNLLRARVPGARVLDAFAGTGAVGIEALSRGAAHVSFVERDPRACRLMAENLRRCGVDGGYTMTRAAFPDAVDQLPGPFDIVFLDPPYDDPALDQHVAAGLGLLAPHGVLVLEHARRRAAPLIAGRGPAREVVAGDSALAIYAAEAAPAAGPDPGGETGEER